MRVTSGTTNFPEMLVLGNLMPTEEVAIHRKTWETPSRIGPG
jgi:hypothetical protein